MARKWFSPISIIVFVLGIAMVVWSLSRGDGSSTAPSNSQVESTISPENSTGISSITESTSDVSTPLGSVTDTASSTPSSGGSSPAPSSPTATTVAPSSPPVVTVRPLPPAPSITTTAVVTVAPLSIPPLVATPGVVEPPPCVSYADCAQKLFTEWLSGGSGGRTRALSYGTSAAVSALFDRRTIGVTWDPTVYRSTALKYVAAATSRPNGIEFNFTSGQTGYKVQSVVWF